MGFSNNIAVAEVKITGTRPILWHRFGPDTLPLEKTERTGIAGNDPEEWRKTVLKTNDNQLFFDPSYIFACIREGAKYTRKGRASFQTSVSATLQVLDEKILIDRFLPTNISTDTNCPVYLDIRGVRNPVTKARNVRYRVCASSGWKASFHILWDKTIISKTQMHAIIIDAGMYSGIGDARNIGFGRFTVDDLILIDKSENMEYA